MSNFTNTIDILGDIAVADSIIAKSIIEYKDNNVSKVGREAFASCKELKTVDLPNVKIIETSAFSYSTALSSVNLPNVTTIGDSAFKNCTALTSVDLPNITTVDQMVFQSCSTLATVNLPNVTSILNSAFSSCKALTTLILHSTTMCALNDTSAFTSTPIASGTGYIYVPSVLLGDYISNKNWGVYAESFRPIEGGFGYVERIDTLFSKTKAVRVGYYAPIGDSDATISNLQITPSDSSAITITDTNIADGYIAFNVNTLTTDGAFTVTINADIGGDAFTTSFEVNVYETAPEPTYSVEAVSGASYGFALNDAGYYESQGKSGYNASLCKIVFDTKGFYNVYLDCINSGENNKNYGLLSNIDVTLSTSFQEDSSSKVFKSFKTLSSSEVQTVDYGAIGSGEHFIYAKYTKYNHNVVGNDSLQFKVRFELI